jgi:hypothetical protein
VRLDEISRHPIIRKGIVAVRVVLHFYDSVLADDILAFAGYNHHKLREITKSLEIEIVYCSNKLDTCPEVVIDAANKAKAILDSWRNFVLGTPDNPASEDDWSHRMIIRKAHEKYRQLFADQERMRKDGVFVRDVAAAVARMPIATRLELHNMHMDSHRGPSYYVDHATDTETLIRMMLLPTGLQESVLHDLGQPPVEMFVKLPIAIHEAGRFLNALDICLPPVQDYSILATSQEDCQDLSAALQRLKIFTFHPQPRAQSYEWDPRELGQVENLGIFFATLTNTKSIEHIDVNLWDVDGLSLFDMCSINDIWPWQHLRFFRWSLGSLHIAELERFFDRLSTPIPFLCLSYTHLLSGSWADVLDILRANSTPEWRFNSPSGGECELLSMEEIASVFDVPHPSTSGPPSYEYIYNPGKAERYIRKSIDQNPLSDTGATLSNTD